MRASVVQPPEPMPTPKPADQRVAAARSGTQPRLSVAPKPPPLERPVVPAEATTVETNPAHAAPRPVASPASKPATPVIYHPASAAVAAIQANKAAMAALDAGDPAGFARALGIEDPGGEFLAAAAAPGSPFDLQSKGPWPIVATRADARNDAGFDVTPGRVAKA